MLKKYCQIVKNENTQSKIKPIKTGKKTWNNVLLGCQDYSHNFRPQEVKMTNKVLREKYNCVVCESNKSRFLKKKNKKHSNKN